MSMTWLMTATGRRWIYGVSVASIALLVAYGIVRSDQAPLWLSLAAAVLGLAGPATALGHVTPDPVDEDTPALDSDED